MQNMFLVKFIRYYIGKFYFFVFFVLTKCLQLSDVSVPASFAWYFNSPYYCEFMPNVSLGFIAQNGSVLSLPFEVDFNQLSSLVMHGEYFCQISNLLDLMCT